VVLYTLQLSEEIEKLSLLGGLKRSEHVVQLARLMVRAESVEHRSSLLNTILVCISLNYGPSLSI